MPRRSMLGAMQALLTNEQISKDFRNLVAGGLLQSMNDTTVEPGRMAAVGENFLYEMLRYTDLENNPELGLQILKNYERGVPPESRGWWSAVFQGDVWGNPGLFRCAEILSDRGDEALAAELTAEFKRQIPLVKQQRAKTKDARTIGALDGLIEDLVRRTDPEMSWRPFVATSKRKPQAWRYLMWNAATGPFVPTDGDTRVPAAPPPDALKDWNLPEFDDSKWAEGNGAFGVWRDLFGYLVETFNTEITKDHVFLRKTFTLDEENATLPLLRLKVLSREAVEIYLNGQSIYASDKTERRPRYQIVALGEEHRALLRKGRNTLAVATRINYFQGNPYGLIDVGLEGARTMGVED